MIHIDGVGNLTDDPDFRFVGTNSTPVVEFTIADTPRRKDGNEWVDEETVFLKCKAWGELAENIAESLKKGDRVTVAGRLKARSWMNEGAKRTIHEVVCDVVGPDLRYATATARRVGARTAKPAAPVNDKDPWATAPATDEPPF